MRRTSRTLPALSFVVIVVLAFIFVPPAAAASTITIAVGFTAGDVGNNCYAAASLNPIISFGSSGGTFSEVTNDASAGAAAPECALRDAFIEINLATRATGIEFNYIALDDTQNITVNLSDGVTPVNSDSFDNTGTAGVYTYNGAFFDTVYIGINSVSSANPLRTTRLDEFKFIFPGDDPVANAIANQGFAPNDDRIGAHASVEINSYLLESGLAIYRTTSGGTKLALYVPNSAIEAAGIPAHGNAVMILEGDGVQVYRLADGLFQVMDAVTIEGKRDFLIFEVDADGNVVRWRRGTFNIYTQRTSIYAQSNPDHWIGYPVEY